MFRNIGKTGRDSVLVQHLAADAVPEQKDDQSSGLENQAAALPGFRREKQRGRIAERCTLGLGKRKVKAEGRRWMGKRRNI